MTAKACRHLLETAQIVVGLEKRIERTPHTPSVSIHHVGTQHFIREASRT